MSLYKVDGSPVEIAYRVSGEILTSAYDATGQEIYDNTVDYDSYTYDSMYTLSTLSSHTQGFDIYGGVICAFRADDKMYLFNLSDGSTITSNISAVSSHGDSASFGNEFYDPADEFPLIYVTSDKTPAEIYVNRITRSSSTLIRTLKFPATAGYYGAASVDSANNNIYILSYKEQNYTSDNSGANKTVVSKWDLSNLTDNGDGTYTPEFISQYERPFIYVMQGLTFHDNMIWIASGYGSVASHIYAMNPDTGEILHTITLPNSTEIEGVSFVKDTNDEYYMVVLQWGGVFTKYTFGTA